MTQSIIGGVMIGVAAVWLMASIGRIAGITGIATAALKRPHPAWAMLFVLGLLLGGGATMIILDVPVVRDWDAVTPLLVAGAFLVGIGTRLGSGCTSGHGVCGMARLSKRSLVATLTFMAAGMLTATVVHT